MNTWRDQLKEFQLYKLRYEQMKRPIKRISISMQRILTHLAQITQPLCVFKVLLISCYKGTRFALFRFYSFMNQINLASILRIRVIGNQTFFLGNTGYLFRTPLDGHKNLLAEGTSSQDKLDELSSLGSRPVGFIPFMRILMVEKHVKNFLHRNENIEA